MQLLKARPGADFLELDRGAWEGAPGLSSAMGQLSPPSQASFLLVFRGSDLVLGRRDGLLLPWT